MRKLIIILFITVYIVYYVFFSRLKLQVANTSKKIAIIGGGISGLYIANLLAKNSNYEIKVYEKNFKLRDVLKADEAFVTGTFANIIPVKKINNKIFDIKNNFMTKNLRDLYLELME